MPVYFHRPENALNRAREFIDVGKKQSALEVLSDVIRSKKHRQWSETHESIMKLYVRLCVELQKSLSAKDGLYQYRNICKDTNLNSFKCIIEEFLNMAEKKAADAREESAQTVLDIEDLDAMQTPESILLSTVSGEDTQDRTDRIVLTPWVKFLWESFRNILELLKNNHLLEKIYTDVAKRAFRFCLQYKRRTEFHKLCDILRNHLNHLKNLLEKHQAAKSDSSEVIQCLVTLVDTRFEQLDKAISIDLWQEAFKAIEDIHYIHSLISGPKQKIKASLLENFYQKQSSVYWMANNKLFHAAALQRLFGLRKEQKKTFTLDSEEAKKTATQVLLATLAVPVVPIPSEIDRFLIADSNTQDKSRRLSALLHIQTPPTRASLINDLTGLGVFQCVSTDLLQLYEYLEVEFNPLQICSKVDVLLEVLTANEETAVYVESLREVTLVRLIKQVSQVYQSVHFSRLAELAKFATPMQLERIVVEAARTNGIQVKIDHRSQSLWFGTDINLSHHDEAPEGPVIQSMPSEVFGNHLIVMAQALHQAARILCTHEIEMEHKEKCQKVFKKYQQHEAEDCKALVQRKKAIEERKVYLENQQKKKEKQEREEEERKELKLRKERMKSHEDDIKKEEEEKKKKDFEEVRRKMAQDKLEALKKTPLGARAFADVTAADLKDLDPNDIMVKQLQQMEKERKDKETKLKGQEKKIDYFERAKRVVEIPLLEKYYQEQIEKDRQLHEELEEEKITKAITEHEKYEATRARFDKIEEDKDDFLKIIENKREEQFKEQLVEFEVMLAEERMKRLEQRKQERKKKRKSEAEAIKKEEENRQIRERAEAEKRRKEEERRLHDEKMEQQRLKQLEREKEIEEKLRRKEEERKREEEMKMQENKRRDDDNWRNPEAESWRRKEASPTPIRRRDEDRPSRAYRPPAQRREDSWRQLDSERERETEGDRRWPSPIRSSWKDDRGSRFREDTWRREDQDRYPDRRDRDQDRYPDRRDRDQDRYPDRRDRDQDRYPDRRDRDQDRYPDRRERDRDIDRYPDRRDRDRDQDRYLDRRDRNPDRYPDRRDWDRGPDRYRDSDRRDQGGDRDRLGWRDSQRDQGHRRISPVRRDQEERGSWRRDNPPPSKDEGHRGDPEEEGWETVTRRR